MNIERHNAIIAKIEANPQCWDQTTWHCGTAHCYAGHAQIESGVKPNVDTVRHDARIWLNLSRAEADYLFEGDRSLAELKAGPAGYDSDGYNCAGYDADGLDINNKPKAEG